MVANKAREPEDPEGFYKRLLTQCWRESYRILKPGGILAFTFHHSQDDPWMSVLESLFEAGFYLEATYPIRSDETKGEGEFGSRKVEYDIIHVCRKRLKEPEPISWAKMRRRIIQEVRQLQRLLEHHATEGLPAADLQVIKRGKALEHYSRHYGKVMVDEGQAMEGVRDAIVGINLMLDEEAGRTAEVPPVNAQPLTRQFLRIFADGPVQPRDQLQKFLRGSGVTPNEFEARGWCAEDKRAKTFTVVPPLDFAMAWKGRHRSKMVYDYDQAMYLIGACVEESGINASETLRNVDFRPHPALKALLDWHTRAAMPVEVRQAARKALKLYDAWENSHKEQAQQLHLNFGG